MYFLDGQVHHLRQILQNIVLENVLRNFWNVQGSVKLNQKSPENDATWDLASTFLQFSFLIHPVILQVLYILLVSFLFQMFSIPP